MRTAGFRSSATDWRFAPDRLRTRYDLPGVADAPTTMLTEGTESMSSREIADEVARLGAMITAGAGADHSTVAASALAQYGDHILGLLADVALRPSFPENELENVRQSAIQGLIAQRGQPAFLANERISRVIFGDHPYAVVAPTQSSLEAINAETLREFHRQYFVPNAAVLFVVGDVERDAVLRRAEELFGQWPAGSVPSEDYPSPTPGSSRKAYIVDRPGSAQSNIVIANLGITRTSPDYFPMLLMHTVLGANASSRLFMNLREDKGYTYGAYSSLDARRTSGSFRATAEVRTPVTGDSLKEFFNELERIRHEEVSDKELADAQSFLTGVFPIRIETQEGLIDQLVQIKMFDLPANYLHTYRDQVTSVTKEDVRRVAHQYITPDKAAIVVVGDAQAAIEQIKPFTEDFEIYSSSGKRKISARDAGESISSRARRNVGADDQYSRRRPTARHAQD
ncbi:MAG: pitrilysin family protein [Pyrinomonadaceae bacterium]